LMNRLVNESLLANVHPEKIDHRHSHQFAHPA